MNIVSYYLVYAVTAIGFILVAGLLFGLLFKKRIKRMDNNWSTADFLPIICCVLIGLLVGQAVQLVVLERVLAIENEAVFDGLSNAVTVTIGIWGMYWYKTRN